MKRTLKGLLSMVIVCWCMASLQAQQNNTVYFTGLGRAIVSNNSLKGNVLENDTVSGVRDLNGTFFFDLGINVEPAEYLRAIALLRVQNEFGGFFGIGSFLEFRQLTIQGVIEDKVNYQIGDMDLKSTPYTLYNFDPVYNDYESELFRMRREIAEYENFMTDENTWRLQGVQVGTQLNVSKVMDNVGVNLFGTRIRKRDVLAIPDRLLYGGNLDFNIIQDKIQVGINHVGVNDIAGSVQNNEVFFNNQVFTADFKLNFGNEIFGISPFAEAGINSYENSRIIDDTSASNNDAFFDGGVTASLKKLGLDLTVSYRQVGDDFISPGAQSLRIGNTLTPALFSDQANATEGLLSIAGNRRMLLMDRYTDPSVYDVSIDSRLMPYYPEFGNITPYGRATPNRQGVSANVTYGNKDSLIQVSVGTDILQEKLGEGTTETRKFFGIKGGTWFNLHQLVDFEKHLVINAGIRMENTTRGAGNIDLSSMLIDAGLDIEVAKNFDLLAGLKMFSASGDEVYVFRDEFNQIDLSSFINYTVDMVETDITFGAKYRFSNFSSLSVQGLLVSYDDKTDDTQNFNISQVFFYYTLAF